MPGGFFVESKKNQKKVRKIFVFKFLVISLQCETKQQSNENRNFEANDEH